MPSVDLLVVTTASSLTAGIKRIHLIQRLVSCEMLFYLEDAPCHITKEVQVEMEPFVQKTKNFVSNITS